jgi:hypothetical protein
MARRCGEERRLRVDEGVERKLSVWTLVEAYDKAS